MNIIKRILRSIFSWSPQIPSQDDLESAGIIVTMSWSQNRDGTPGLGNQILARVAAMCSCALGNKPVFPTAEVAECLSSQITKVGVIAGAGDTFAAARIQADYCRKNQISSVIVVAHPLHMNRVIWTFERLGIRALPARMPIDYSCYQGPELVHFTSRYHWILFWLREEFLARPVYLLQGKI